MSYNVTPFNITAGLLIILAIYSFITAPSGGDGLSNFWVIPMLILAMTFAGVDYFLQNNITHYWGLLVGEAIVVIALITLAYFNGFINF